MSIKNIIFDWSGTLSDDLTPVYQTLMLVFKRLGKEQISLEEYKREFTMPYMVFWNRYFPQLSKEEEEADYLDFKRMKREKAQKWER